MCETLRYEINVVVVVVMVIFVHLDCSITSITCMHNKKVFIEPPRVVCFMFSNATFLEQGVQCYSWQDSSLL